jgi:hypothetical protein
MIKTVDDVERTETIITLSSTKDLDGEPLDGGWEFRLSVWRL